MLFKPALATTSRKQSQPLHQHLELSRALKSNAGHPEGHVTLPCHDLPTVPSAVTHAGNKLLTPENLSEVPPWESRLLLKSRLLVLLFPSFLLEGLNGNKEANLGRCVLRVPLLRSSSAQWWCACLAYVSAPNKYQT